MSTYQPTPRRPAPLRLHDRQEEARRERADRKTATRTVRALLVLAWVSVGAVAGLLALGVLANADAYASAPIPREVAVCVVALPTLACLAVGMIHSHLRDPNRPL